MTNPETAVIQHFSPGGWIHYTAHFIDEIAAARLQSWLTSHVSWAQASLVLFGRDVREPRLSAWFGDRDYTYSGRTLVAAPFPEPVSELCQRVERASRQRFNSVLINRYRDGQDSMGYHSDDEPELGRDPVIASVSLGARRRFLVRAKRKSREAESASYDLDSGSLLIMGGTLQHHYRHALPKRPGLAGERINLTFRLIHERMS